MRRYYIAYGSNMDMEQMRHRCPDARVVGKGMVTGFRLLFKGSKTGSYATIEKKKQGNVPVLLWTISEADERNLDHYEGYPAFYYKATLPVRMDSRRVRGIAYIMHEDRKFGLPSAFYYGVLAKAYNRFGMDIRILERALADTYWEIERGGRKMVPTRVMVERLRRENPVGMTVRLVSMDDPQAPPVGTMGTVEGVDDMGGIMVRWETGSGLSLIPGVDDWERVKL